MNFKVKMEKEIKQSEQVIERRPEARSLLRDTRGANYMEYIVLVAVVVLVGIAGWKKFGDAVKGTVDSYGSAVENMKASSP